MSLLSKARQLPKLGKPTRRGRPTLWTKDLRATVELLRERGYSWERIFGWLIKHGEVQFPNQDSLKSSYYALRRKGAK